MKAFVLALSVVSLAMSLPMAIDASIIHQASAVASRALSVWTPAQTLGPCEFQSRLNNEAGGREAHVCSSVANGYVPDNVTEITDNYLFQLSINEFEAKRDLHQPATLDWSSDGCTKAPDKIRNWYFLPACHRHDFGLRNYRQQGRLNKLTKRPIDDQFLEE